MKARLVSRRVHEPPALGAVVYDAKRFLLSHSSIIEEAPLQAYCSALVFSPEASIIRQLYMGELPQWIVRAPALSEDWSVHLQTLGHPSVVRAVAVSHDGRFIVSGSNDKTVRIWDAATGAERGVLPIGTSLRHLSFFSCGQHLFTDRGSLQLPLSNCQCGRHVFATKSWITKGGDDLLYLHPDYQDSFGLLSGSIVIFMGKVSHVLELNLSQESMSECL